jgi:DNA-binding NarL/FixJ family response regulator
MSINKVFIIEDLPTVLEWLCQSIQLVYSDAEIITAVNLASALEEVSKQEFDLALVDIGLPDGSGLDVVDYLTQNKKSTLIVMTTIFDDDQHVFRALRKGAKGYILKDQDKQQLAQMLQNIEKGQQPISPAIANKLLNFFNPQLPQNNLTAREKDVLTLIAKGYKVPEVSDMIGIKSSTCYGYVKDIYQKLDINSRAEATIEATKMGLIDHNL